MKVITLAFLLSMAPVVALSADRHEATISGYEADHYAVTVQIGQQLTQKVVAPLPQSGARRTTRARSRLQSLVVRTRRAIPPRTTNSAKKGPKKQGSFSPRNSRMRSSLLRRRAMNWTVKWSS